MNPLMWVIYFITMVYKKCHWYFSDNKDYLSDEWFKSFNKSYQGEK